jgi:hypothetical protein
MDGSEKKSASPLCFISSNTYWIEIYLSYIEQLNDRRGFQKFVDWRQCAAVMPSCRGGGNVIVA